MLILLQRYQLFYSNQLHLYLINLLYIYLQNDEYSETPELKCQPNQKRVNQIFHDSTGIKGITHKKREKTKKKRGNSTNKTIF